jgi:cell division protein FtsZ
MDQEKAEQKRIAVVGLGGAGVKVLGRLAKSPHAALLKLLAVDTDSALLDGSGLAEEQKYLADIKWRQGRGCGGNIIEGQRSISRERAQLEDMLAGSSLLIVTGGLGGGTATGGVAVFAGIARKLKIPSIFIITMPFSLEGHSKRRTAENGIKELLPVADVLLYLPNDLLFSRLAGDTPVAQAFEMADMELARAIVGVSEIISHGNLLAANLADIKEALNKQKSFASIGVGTADSDDGLNRNHIALQRMLDSPLLGGVEKLREADTVIVSLTGGADMKIDETKKTLEAFEKFVSPDCELIVGANTAESYGSQIQITAVAIKFDQQKTKESVSASVIPGLQENGPEMEKPKPASLFGPELEQGELPLQNISRGIFLNTSPVIYQGDDLDVPTFQRKGIIIDKGGK